MRLTSTALVQGCFAEVFAGHVPAYMDGEEALHVENCMLTKMGHKELSARPSITNQAKRLQVLPMCKEKAGHGGKHVCAEKEHTCGLPCKLSAAPTCRGFSGREPGHAGDCDCGSGNHLCGAPCALPGCKGRCTVPYGTEHAVRACEDTVCPEVLPHTDSTRTYRRLILPLRWQLQGSNTVLTPSVCCSAARSAIAGVQRGTSML